MRVKGRTAYLIAAPLLLLAVQMYWRLGSLNAVTASASNDGGGAVGQAAPIPTETPTMSFDWAAPPQQPEQQQAYGASAPAAIGASFA